MWKAVLIVVLCQRLFEKEKDPSLDLTSQKTSAISSLVPNETQIMLFVTRKSQYLIDARIYTMNNPLQVTNND